MADRFSEQLSRRIPIVCPAPDQEDYGLYIRLMRMQLGVDRRQLAEQAGLERQYLSLLENGLLLPDELTKEVRERIEQAFRKLVAKLQPDWSNEQLTEECSTLSVRAVWWLCTVTGCSELKLLLE